MKQMRRILLVGLVSMILLSCGTKNDQPNNQNANSLMSKSSVQKVSYKMIVSPGTAGYTLLDTVNGQEIRVWVRDTLVTVNIPYQKIDTIKGTVQYNYTKTLVDTFMRSIAGTGGGSTSGGGGDTTVVTQPTQYEGFGSQAVGGSNSSTIYHVTNLNTSGVGSLTNGIGSNKTILFDVSGTLNGRYDLIGVSYLTISGNGHDVTIDNKVAGDAISFDGANTHHCILTGIRTINAGGDGINVIDGAHDIVIDHCSSYGNRDGNIDIAGDNAGLTKNVTVQWCIIGGGVSSSYSGSTLVTGQSVSIHHNLYIPSFLPPGTQDVGRVQERCPFIHCKYSPVGSPNCDFRNNLVFNWGRYASGFGYKAAVNIVNNYYASNKTGAIDPNADPSGNGTNHANYFISGNLMLGSTPISVASNHTEYIIVTPYKVTTTDAKTAAKSILAGAGTAVHNKTENDASNAITVN